MILGVFADGWLLSRVSPGEWRGIGPRVGGYESISVHVWVLIHLTTGLMGSSSSSSSSSFSFSSSYEGFAEGLHLSIQYASFPSLFVVDMINHVLLIPSESRSQRVVASWAMLVRMSGGIMGWLWV
jgi:hypothetical protein